MYDRPLDNTTNPAANPANIANRSSSSSSSTEHQLTGNRFAMLNADNSTLLANVAASGQGVTERTAF
jgi:hypothetical protein